MKIRHLTGHTGAEAVGIDLTQPVSAETKAALNDVFIKHGVLVIRDQALTPEQMLAAVELFGSVFHQHNTRFALPGCPQIVESDLRNALDVQQLALGVVRVDDADLDPRLLPHRAHLGEAEFLGARHRDQHPRRGLGEQRHERVEIRR